MSRPRPAAAGHTRPAAAGDTRPAKAGVTRPAEAGFTLLEAIVAIVVLGFVMAGLAQGARFGMQAWKRQARFTAEQAARERVDHVLRMLIERASPPLDADDKPFAGQEHRLVFVTRLPEQPPAGPVTRAEVAIGVDAAHRLLLRWLPHPTARAIKPLPPPEELVLAEGVDHLDLRYRSAAADGGKWKTVWDDAALPALVEIAIALEDQKRHWPAIEVAPMLDTNGSF